MTFHRDFKNKRILVTGAGGFIGSHLTEALLELSAEVRAFVHYNSRNDWGFLEELSQEAKYSIDVISADLRDYHAVKQATKQVDIVFHLGASIGIPYSLAYPNDVVETNVIGTLNILKASLENKYQRLSIPPQARYMELRNMSPLMKDTPFSLNLRTRQVKSQRISWQNPSFDPMACQYLS